MHAPTCCLEPVHAKDEHVVSSWAIVWPLAASRQPLHGTACSGNAAAVADSTRFTWYDDV